MTDRHEHFDEGTIHAWLDGALAPDESARVESSAEACAECAARVAEARGLIAASSRILSSLDAVPAGVIPGSGVQGDQLAALRARRQASTRRWWQDRRVMVAASLVFVAGVSSLVMRKSPEEVISPTTQLTAESSRSAPDSTPLAAAAPPSAAPAPTAARAASMRDSKAEQMNPAADVAQTRVAAAPPMDTVTERKAVAEKVAAPPAPVAANEARRSDFATVGRSRAADSLAIQRDQAAVIQRPLRQEGTRQALQQVGVDSIARTAAPRALGAGVQRGAIGGLAGAAAMADAAGPGGTCYRLSGLTAPAVTDTVRLLNEMAPVLSDPSWFRTQRYGALRDTTLAWRSIDSVTVELRARFGSDTTALRFRIDGAAPDGRSLQRVRLEFATRVACPR